ncbi:MexH family multidrug efflux RND transporter periplasmic adaptor subunit [Cellvibrio zantedeschiae]|uniref:MexH family multidrug efflux RND transporter periplasmic adaptor subunit n=1 Tax=Cellvibrio zantedeschiae TaxID=1237077 RepID=A0ABQ3AWS4_9GAMM|nr:efflux RND transporter periplasmic adaptor subunit [Cellvibrio zantedeschiae]GGY68698.1 MexH family multidrug efflux RND transporter periplasmic adaptor subunit [Cellvibrio zantedeschiae]
MPNKTLIALGLAALLSACGASKEAPSKETKQAMLVVKEDLVTISSSRVASGPIISGSLEAKKQADLRAEVSAIVVQVLKDNGDKVQAGDLLVRLDDTIYRQALISSQEAERAAQQSFDQAERQFNRLKALSTSGAVSTQAREDAELRRNAAQSELAAARARLAQDTQQLARTQVRAPFAGVVGNREASNGDTAQVGKALLKVIDPSSIRFEGFVPSDQIQHVKVGQAVNFYVNGSRDLMHEGKVERINPVADTSTRQVGVQVSLKDTKNLTVGLFAEGRVQSLTEQSLTIPETSLVQQGDHAYIWRVQQGKLNKVEIQLGTRDVQSGDFAIKSGLNEGDTILRHPRGILVDGALVSVEKTPANTAKSAMNAKPAVAPSAKKEG